VYVDPRCGHIRVDEVTFCDMGTSLSVWSHEGATLTPETATRLAEALTAWAGRAAARQVIPARNEATL
jgi:hypothetical protein